MSGHRFKNNNPWYVDGWTLEGKGGGYRTSFPPWKKPSSTPGSGVQAEP